VALSYRGDAFNRAKQRNRDRVAASERAGRLRILLRSDVRSITASSVAIGCEGREIELGNDAVIVSAGGILPTDFLRSVGIEVETKYGTA
jgi:thioredoxin reductase